MKCRKIKSKSGSVNIFIRVFFPSSFEAMGWCRRFRFRVNIKEEENGSPEVMIDIQKYFDAIFQLMDKTATANFLIHVNWDEVSVGQAIQFICVYWGDVNDSMFLYNVLCARAIGERIFTKKKTRQQPEREAVPLHFSSFMQKHFVKHGPKWHTSFCFCNDRHICSWRMYIANGTLKKTHRSIFIVWYTVRGM